MPSPTRVFGNKPTPVDHTNVPTAVFSEPEVGVIGLTEAQACEQLAKVDIYKTTFRPMKATLSGRDTRTFMKLVVDGLTDRVVGCHIVGPDAGEMIQLIGIAVKMKATKADFDATMAVHPTAAEELVTMRDEDRDPRPRRRRNSFVFRGLTAIWAVAALPRRAGIFRPLLVISPRPDTGNSNSGVLRRGRALDA